MRHALSSILLFLVVASLALACEAVTHANDFATAQAVSSCGTGTLFCNGTCVAQDTKNCTGCGAGCDPGQVCSNGTCGSQCSGGTTQCTAADGTAVCVDTQNDPLNCGRCGGEPDAGSCPICQDGACAATCSADATLCNGKCVDESTDGKNCGGCTTTAQSFACPGEQLCSGGTCSTSCVSPLKKCGSSCIDESTDVNNCGGCTTANQSFKCTNPSSGHGLAVCGEVLGKIGCGVACENGFTNCSGQCLCGDMCPPAGVDTGGGFAVPCGPQGACVGGQCTVGVAH